ncbi:putative ABC transport system permease protein [Mucilaginibacter frigoritolerans]|uniref:Putative ABC transport system permease protein n=1 Tax=Mucilaginibacter frigoritolerans TaxID=652788 RepID=A0A562TWW9_9SPHI|nr:ABC transporter permease [Mucilaginibacter frigoritolerans]TWI98091.1 putative ABC transport system permease protein [Mucilaginibacter frigoritolerans]
MFKNYFKIAFRNLWRNKAFSAINILGLALGLAVCLLITLFVSDELGYDKYNSNADRVYRVNSDFKVNGSVFNDRESPAAMAGTLMKDYPQIEQATRLKDNGKVLVKKGDQALFEPNWFFGDANLFDVFTVQMIAGNKKNALKEPHSIVISEYIARKYFNSTDVIGKTLRLNNTDDYKITGVITNMPAQSHIHFNLISAMSGRADSYNTNWINVNYLTYVLVRKGISQQDLDGYLKEATKKYAEPLLKNYIHTSIADLENKGDHFKFVTIPLTKIHSYSTLINEQEPSGNIQYVYIFIVIAVFILLIACVNFMNLSTARSAGRSKEVGVRKVLGSSRSTLIYQFLTESILTSFLALIIALGLAELIIPYFNQLSGKEISLNLVLNIWLLPYLLISTLIIGILAGVYPAFFMSAFQPIEVLKGKLASGFKGSWLRNSLVVFQFSTVIVLIVGTLVIYSQLNYIRNKKLGYNREQVLVLQNTYSLFNHARSFKQDVLKLAGVKSGTMTPYLPTSQNGNTEVYGKDAALSAGQSTALATWYIDEDYIPTLGMDMAAGRNFTKGTLTDSSSAIINETAAQMLGYNNDPLNKKIFKGNGVPINIIGIVKDFNSGSLHNKIEPLVLRLSEQRGGMAFRIQTQNIPVLISQIQTLYHSADANMAGQPFTYSFMDDDFNHLYQSEQNTGKIFVSFALFAILIACLGLFGLVTYAAEQRTKEIGIRKVLGASVTNIVRMLSGDFLKLVGIAAVIAFPIAWYAMNRWLQDFAYRTTISWWIFATAALLAVIITITTVSFRAIKAALMNPVSSLKTE